MRCRVVFDRVKLSRYNERLMFDAPILDTRRFIACADQVSGVVMPAQVPALQESLFSGEGEIRWSLTGRMDAQNRRELEVTVAGELWLTCRRCLTGFRFSLASRSRILLVAREADLPELDDEDPDIETLVMPEEIRVADWVSDEVVLALPLAPEHPEGCCQVDAVAGVDVTRAKPFEALAALKREI